MFISVLLQLLNLRLLNQEAVGTVCADTKQYVGKKEAESIKRHGQLALLLLRWYILFGILGGFTGCYGNRTYCSAFSAATLQAGFIKVELRLFI